MTKKFKHKDQQFQIRLREEKSDCTKLTFYYIDSKYVMLSSMTKGASIPTFLIWGTSLWSLCIKPLVHDRSERGVLLRGFVNIHVEHQLYCSWAEAGVSVNIWS